MADNYIFFENGMFIEPSDKILKKLNLNMHDFFITYILIMLMMQKSRKHTKTPESNMIHLTLLD